MTMWVTVHIAGMLYDYLWGASCLVRFLTLPSLQAIRLQLERIQIPILESFASVVARNWSNYILMHSLTRQ